MTETKKTTQELFECCKCGGEMEGGIALAQTWKPGVPDARCDERAQTMRPGGPGKVIRVSKCKSCGWSTT